jgi:hypothetical protein
VDKEIMMAPQSLAETLRQDSMKRAEREEEAQYIRAALAAREAAARRAAQQSTQPAAGRFPWASRVRALVHIY